MDLPLQRFRTLSAKDSSLPEKVIRHVAKAILEPEDIVVDGGAFMGWHTTHFLHSCHRGRVIAYEANPVFADRLTDQFAAVDHVEIRACALQDDARAQSLEFQVDQTHPSRSTLSPDPHAEVSTETVITEAVTLDADLAVLAASPAAVRLVKLDVEGSEFAALRGARDLLTTGRPLVVVEHGADAPRVGGYRIADLDAFVRGCDYQVVAFDGTPISGFGTDYWYFWLVPNEAMALTSAISAGFTHVLGQQESDRRVDLVRRAGHRFGVAAVQTIAPRVPEAIKRRLRRVRT